MYRRSMCGACWGREKFSVLGNFRFAKLYVVAKSGKQFQCKIVLIFTNQQRMLFCRCFHFLSTEHS